MARWGSALAVGAWSLLAACSSGGGSDAVETSIGVSSAPSSPDTSTTTETPTTTAAPPTTIDPAEALAAEVEADLLEALQLGREASMDPFDLDAELAALALRVGVVRSNLEAKLADYRERSLAIRENTTTPASVVVERAARPVLGSDDVVEIQVCEIDSWILVEVGAGPDGGEAVVDPDVVAYRTNFFLRLVDGRWRVEAGNEIARWEGSSSCAPA